MTRFDVFASNAQNDNDLAHRRLSAYALGGPASSPGGEAWSPAGECVQGEGDENASRGLITATILTAIMFIADTALAQQERSACAILAEKISQDISTQASSDARSSIYRGIISDRKYSDYRTANDTKFGLGLSIASYVDLSLNVASDENTWGRHWEEFLKLTSSQTRSNIQSATLLQTWNPAIIADILKYCPPPGGFYGQLTSVNNELGAFTITLHGQGRWSLSGFDISPEDPLFNCGTVPSDQVNDAILNCTKIQTKQYISLLRILQRTSDHLKFIPTQMTSVARMKISKSAKEVRSLN